MANCWCKSKFHYPGEWTRHQEDKKQNKELLAAVEEVKKRSKK